MKYKSFVNSFISGIITDRTKELKKKKILTPKKSLKLDFYLQYDESNLETMKKLAYYDACMFYHTGEEFVYAPTIEQDYAFELDYDLDINESDIRVNSSLKNTKYVAMPYDHLKHNEIPASKELSTPLEGTESNEILSEVADASQKLLNKDLTNEFNNLISSKADTGAFIKNLQAYNVSEMMVIEGETKSHMIKLGGVITCSRHPLLSEPSVCIYNKLVLKNNSFRNEFKSIPLKMKVASNLQKNTNTKVEPAIVISNIEKDKDGKEIKLARVRIRFLWDNDGEALTWARVAQTGAGSKDGTSYGSNFTPRVGDQVLVISQHGEPSLPVIIGSLYHSESPPYLQSPNGTQEILLARTVNESTIRITEFNKKHVIEMYHKDGGKVDYDGSTGKAHKNIIRLEVDDKGRSPVITIESLNGEINIKSKMINIIADEKLTMKANEILMESVNDTNFKIGGNFKQLVNKNMDTKVTGNNSETIAQNKSIKSSMDTKIESGKNISIKASVNVNVQATMVSSKAAATNVIKGGIVQIN